MCEWIRVSLVPVLNVLAQTRTKYFEVPDETSGSQFFMCAGAKSPEGSGPGETDSSGQSSVMMERFWTPIRVKCGETFINGS